MVLADLLESTGREVVDGVDLQMLARMFVAASDGCAVRLRIDPELDPGIIPWMFLSIIDGTTRRVGTRDDLPGHRLTVDGQEPFDPMERAAVHGAVLRVHSRAGWPAVTLAKVSQLSGVSDGRLAGAFPSRHDLGTIVWDEVVTGIERRHEARRGLEPSAWLFTLLDDVCDAACAERALVSSMLISRLNATAESSDEPVDPGSARFVDLFATTIAGAVEAQGTSPSSAAPPIAAGDGFRVMARATLDLILLRASLSPMSGPELTSLVVDGMGGSGVTVVPPG